MNIMFCDVGESKHLIELRTSSSTRRQRPMKLAIAGLTTSDRTRQLAIAFYQNPGTWVLVEHCLAAIYDMNRPNKDSTSTFSGATASSNPKVRGRKNVHIEHQMEAQVSALQRMSNALGDLATVRQQIDSINEFLERLRCVVTLTEDEDLFEACVARLESLILLLIDLSRRKSIGDMILPLITYSKTWFPTRSYGHEIVKIIKQVTDDLKVDDDEEMEGQAGWFTSNWERLVEGPFGKKMSNALSLFIILGFLPKTCEGVIKIGRAHV